MTMNTLRHPCRRRRQPHPEAGSAVVEVVIGFPVFLLFVAVAIFGGRVSIAHQAVQTAASDGARAASLARTASAARADALSAVQHSLTNQDVDCATTDVAVDVGGFQVQVGLPASVAVTVSCAVPLDDLGIPGADGSRLVSATMPSPLDTFRGR